MVEAPEAPKPPEPPTGKPEKHKSRVLDWFAKNPTFGLVSFLLTIVSLAATVYFGIAALKSRDLSLTVNPTKTTIVKAGQSSDLHVLYKGESVSTDVTALQVVIWNAGRESIRPEHILSPIVLQTSPKVPILEVRLRRVSRPVCHIALDESQLADGKVGVAWKILEHNDGAIVQFIVAGPSTVTVAGQGTVEGDRSIRLVTTKQTDGQLLTPLAILAFGLVVVVWTLRINMRKYDRINITLPIPRSAHVTPNWMALMWWLLLLGIVAAGVRLGMSLMSGMPLPFD